MKKLNFAWLENVKWAEVLFSGVSGIFSIILFTRENFWLAVFVLALLLMAGIFYLLLRKKKAPDTTEAKTGDSPETGSTEGEKREYFLQGKIRKLAIVLLIVPPVTALTFFYLYYGKEYCCCEGKLQVKIMNFRPGDSDHNDFASWMTDYVDKFSDKDPVAIGRIEEYLQRGDNTVPEQIENLKSKYCIESGIIVYGKENDKGEVSCHIEIINVNRPKQMGNKSKLWIRDSDKEFQLDGIQKQELIGNFIYGLISYSIGTDQAAGDKFQAILDAADLDQYIDLRMISMLYLGHTKFAMERMDEAVKNYSDVLDLDDKNLSALLSRGTTHLEMGNEDNSILDYSRAYRIDQKASEDYFKGLDNATVTSMVELFSHNTGFFSPSENQLPTGGRMPEESKGTKGKVRGSYNDNGKGNSDYSGDFTWNGEVIESESGPEAGYTAEEYFQMATKAKNSFLALEYFEMAKKKDPNLKGIHYYTGFSYHSIDSFSEAILNFTESIRRKDMVTESFRSRGNSYLLSGQYQKAISDFNEVAKHDPEDSEVHFSSGLAWEKLGNPQNAIESYRKAIAIDPYYISAYGNMGKLQEDAGNWSDAKMTYSDALKHFPNNAGFTSDLGRANRKLRQ